MNYKISIDIFNRKTPRSDWSLGESVFFESFLFSAKKIKGPLLSHAGPGLITKSDLNNQRSFFIFSLSDIADSSLLFGVAYRTLTSVCTHERMSKCVVQSASAIRKASSLWYPDVWVDPIDLDGPFPQCESGYDPLRKGRYPGWYACPS